MESKKVEVVCPVFRTESDINVGLLKNLIATLPFHDSKIYQMPAGLGVNKLVNMCRETIQMHDVRHIRTLHTKDNKICETWYYGKTKIDEHSIVINGRINEEAGSIEIFAATPTPESLTGLLAELGHNLTKKFQEAGMESPKIINVSIRDTVMQRSILNLCDTNGVCNEKNVIIEDSLVQHTSINSTPNSSHPTEGVNEHDKDFERIWHDLITNLHAGDVVHTLSQRVRNMVLYIGEDAITVRSERTGTERILKKEDFKPFVTRLAREGYLNVVDIPSQDWIGKGAIIFALLAELNYIGYELSPRRLFLKRT